MAGIDGQSFCIYLGQGSGATVAAAIAGGIPVERIYRALLDPADNFFPLERKHILRFDADKWQRTLSTSPRYRGADASFTYALLADHASDTVVVSGTNDDLRAVIRALRGETPILYTTDVDQLIVLTRFASGAVRVLPMRLSRSTSTGAARVAPIHALERAQGRFEERLPVRRGASAERRSAPRTSAPRPDRALGLTGEFRARFLAVTRTIVRRSR